MTQSGLALASWALLWFATASPFAVAGMMNLPKHMIGHVIVMFAVPMGLIGAATGRTWWWVLPRSLRRRLLRWWYVHRSWRSPTVGGNALVAGLVLNVVMVASHIPFVFDWVMNHGGAMDWLMEPAFLLSGLYFFHFLIPAWPRTVKTRLRFQLLMVVATMVEMLLMAMSMSIFSSASWYGFMTMATMPSMPGMSGAGLTPVAAFQQQQLAAAILWICGDFWAVPCLVLIIRRLIARDGSLLAALDRQASRLSSS